MFKLKFVWKPILTCSHQVNNILKDSVLAGVMFNVKFKKMIVKYNTYPLRFVNSKIIK